MSNNTDYHIGRITVETKLKDWKTDKEVEHSTVYDIDLPPMHNMRIRVEFGDGFVGDDVMDARLLDAVITAATGFKVSSL